MVEALAGHSDIREPLISSGALIVIAVIGAIQAISIAFISRQSNKQKRIAADVKDVRDQIVNHHPKAPNFRDENDGRHEETRRWFRTLQGDIEEIKLTQKMLVEGFLANRKRIQDIEDTHETRRSRREQHTDL